MATSTKNKLTKEHQLFVVELLACFKTPSEIVTAVRETFKIDVTKQTVEGYDPTKYAGRKLNPVLKAYFETARKAYRAGAENIAISNAVYRLEALQRMFESAEKRQNYKLAAELLKQAQDEVAKVKPADGQGAAAIPHLRVTIEQPSSVNGTSSQTSPETGAGTSQ